MDWGLSKVWNEKGESMDDIDEQKVVDAQQKVRSITDEEKLQGTITYMSPEQIRRDPDIDYRTDIFSLGTILFEILAGCPPYDVETVGAMIDKIQNEEPPLPSSLTTVAVPELLERVTMQCLEKEVEKRMPSCADLVRYLEEEW